VIDRQQAIACYVSIVRENYQAPVLLQAFLERVGYADSSGPLDGFEQALLAKVGISSMSA
jgi:hypothetical protein